MLLSLLILIPLLAGLAAFFAGNQAKALALGGSLLTAAVMGYLLSMPAQSAALEFSASWLGSIRANFTLGLDGLGKVTTLLTAVAFPIIFLSIWPNNYRDAHQFYGLMLLTMAGLMGVFLATDALLFYFFWELALIPTYFLCSKWGGERRIAVSFKFFIYTFVGSLMMLIGIIYLYYKTPDQSFSWKSMTQAVLTAKEQAFFFWFFFVAFAIKMPIFPFHTWQPDAYEQSPTATTMVLSGIMVKMGLFGVVRWLLPLFPDMSTKMAPIVIVLCIVGMLYASLIAMRQSNIKRLVAYSSIAHIGLICAALFAQNELAFNGALIQLFSHGVNIIGLWIVIDLIEQQTGITKMDDLGGLAQKAPTMAVLLVVIALANIALPLTNAFVGEFLMFNGLFKYQPWYAVAAGISIILAAVYTLGMIQKVFYGTSQNALVVKDVKPGVAVALVALVVMILAFGIYPKPMLQFSGHHIDSLTSMLVK
ncbi:MAG: NADH-quinone oxidoreductase subunit M [Bacteroidetes bacterium]|nr:MAG: NADH-quinone oxidoreductase subunit M [Bacteroidota bacterium]